MSTSRIPAVLDALVATFDAVMPEAVTDGPPTQTIPNRMLYVGASVGDEPVSFSQSWAGQGHLRRNESMSVPNLLRHRTGNAETKPARDAIFADLALIEDALRNDPTLGLTGFITRAQFGTDGSYTQARDGKGLLCLLAFTIAVDVRI